MNQKNYYFKKKEKNKASYENNITEFTNLMFLTHDNYLSNGLDYEEAQEFFQAVFSYLQKFNCIYSIEQVAEMFKFDSDGYKAIQKSEVRGFVKGIV